MSEEIVYMFDAYMKKSILNCIKRYAKKEIALKEREISIEYISEKLNNCAVFGFNEQDVKSKKLEEYFSDDRVVQSVLNLSEQEKDMLLLTIFCGYSAEHIGEI